MPGLDLIQDLAILLLAAGVAGIICKRLGLSVIVGFLVAGIVIGPHTPPFSLVTDEERVMALSQVGLVFLMFSIGLGLSVSKFARMGAATVIATAAGALMVLVLTEAAGPLAGWTPLQAMFVAAMLMVSSSAVIAKVIAEQKLMHDHASQTALAVTVLEDVVAVAMLTLLASRTSVAGPGSGGMGELLGGLSAFVVLLVGAGLLLVPRLMRQLEIRAEPETQTLIVAGLMCALALSAAKAGYSTALGAFLFGAIVAEIPQKPAVEESFRGLRDVFSSVFFVSIGMMIDLKLLLEVWPLVLAVTAFALLARPLACGLALVVVGTPPREARRAALLLTPLGEFSFIIAQLGVTTAVLAESFYPVAVGASILTILATPTVNRHRSVIVAAWERAEPGFISKALDGYYSWLVELQQRPARTPLWPLARPRLGQLAIEGLFVSGVLIFGELILNRIATAPVLRSFDSVAVSYVFWAVIALIVIVPLVAMWRNAAALAMMIGESWESARMPRRAIEGAVKALAALGLAIWLYLILPHARFSPWGWLAIAVGAVVVVAVFSRRVIYWHSEWVGSVRDVLADNRADLPELRRHARALLGEDLGAWDVALAEVMIPDGSGVAGATLATLALPARFGCAVIEIERNGRPLPSPRADFAVSAGDRLLLVGEQDRLDRARAVLEQGAERVELTHDFARLVLDTCTVPPTHSGRTLAELGGGAQAGVRVVGIQRGGQRIISPQGGERIEAGDTLVVLGTLEAIRRFGHDLSAAPMGESARPAAAREHAAAPPR